MKEVQHRTKIGKIILFANITIFAIIVVLYVLNGFSQKEVYEILRFLVPVKTTYMAPLVMYIIKNKSKGTTPIQKNPERANTKLYASLTTLTISGHLLSLGVFIILSAFNIISFERLGDIIAFIEFFFGGATSLIIADMFHVKIKTNEDAAS